MARYWKAGIGLAFLAYGVYFGYHSMRIFLRMVSLCPELMAAIQQVNEGTKYIHYGFAFLEMGGAVSQIISAVMGLFICCGKRKWKLILTCGIFGTMPYLISWLEVIFFLQNPDASIFVRTLLFMLIPLGIIAFAIYSKTQETKKNAYPYIPVSISCKFVLRKFCYLYRKLIQRVEQKKITWPDQEESHEKNDPDK